MWSRCHRLESLKLPAEIQLNVNSDGKEVKWRAGGNNELKGSWNGDDDDSCSQWALAEEEMEKERKKLNSFEEEN